MNKVRGYRAMLGLTQKDMAIKLNCSVSSYQAKERGDVDFKDVEKIKFLSLVKMVDKSASLEDIFFTAKL
ncbi:transcriptional regulator [Aerococcaceae bacterium NML160702]|nr:transcriptional regulator [Aerococcaceae bacterium NML160702]